MQSYECVIISKMFLIYFISYGCNDSALVFLGGAEASASPSFALPMFITIKKIIILHLFLGVPAATVGGTGTPWHTRGYAPGVYIKVPRERKESRRILMLSKRSRDIFITDPSAQRRSRTHLLTFPRT